MTEIPEEYLVTIESMPSKQFSSWRRTVFSAAIHRLRWNEFPELSESEFRATLAEMLYRSEARNLRPRPNAKDLLREPDQLRP